MYVVVYLTSFFKLLKALVSEHLFNTYIHSTYLPFVNQLSNILVLLLALLLSMYLPSSHTKAKILKNSKSRTKKYVDFCTNFFFACSMYYLSRFKGISQTKSHNR